MNKRIKELAEQAGFDVKRLMAMHPGGFPRDDFLALESFAELIVQECIAQCEKNSGHEYLGSGSKLSAFNIKQHFGIEE